MAELLLVIEVVVLNFKKDSKLYKQRFLYTTSQNRIYSQIPNVSLEQKPMGSTPMLNIAALITIANRWKQQTRR